MLHHKDHHANVKALLGLMIVCLAAGVFLLFYRNQSNIIDGGNFKMFMTLAIVGMGLLLTLFFFANQPHKTAKAAKKRRR